MESFYSIIYYKPNSLTDELLAVGLLASGGEGPFIYISKRRRDLIKKTIHPAQFTSVERHLKNLVKSVSEDQKSPNELLLFDPNYSKDRLEELSQKTNSAVSYGQPTTINEWLNASFFEELVSYFLGDKITDKKKKRSVFRLKWKAFYRSNKFSSWSKDVSAAEVSDTILPINLDLVSDEKMQIIKGVDFDLKPDTVSKRIHELRLLAELFKDHQLIVVHPGPKKQSGKELLNSMEDTVQYIKYINFSEFKQNS